MTTTHQLKSGETLECRIIDDPGDSHVPQVRALLGHKGDPWLYHIDEWAKGCVKKLETRFYVGFIGEHMVGNIMTVEYRGVGLMGHVFTPPEHRRKGICDALMSFHMDDFRGRNGVVLYLNTGYESPPWHIYRKHGYQPLPSRPGSMFWSPGEWEPEHLYGELDRAEVTAVEWQHWPSLNIFTHMPFEHIVRSVTYGLHNVCPSEGQFLAIKRDADRQEPNAQVRIVETGDGHVAGLASLARERRWGSAGATYVFDLFVHPNAGEIAGDLMDEFSWPDAHVLAYAAETDHTTIDLLAEHSFHPHSHVERFFVGGIGLVIMDRD